MRTLFFTTLFVALTSLNVFAQTYQANPDKSTVKWLGKKVTGQHNGAIKIKDGSLTQAKGAVTAGTFVLDMNSITNEDLTNEEYNGKLIGHLKSADFFDVAQYPTATFSITKTVAKKGEGNNNFEVTGDLTIKGVTKSITFPAYILLNKSGFIASAKFTINRTDWGLKYGSKSFIDNIGDKAIDDNIWFDLYVVSK